MSSDKQGISEAIHALKLRKGQPTEEDIPPPTPLPGRKPNVIPGQLSLDEQFPSEDNEPSRAA